MGAVEDAMQNMIKNLEEKTGKTLSQWVKIARSSKLEKHGDILKFLKGEHALTHGYANLVALKARESGDGPASDSDLVAQQYSGAKAPLKPVYEALIAAVKQFGPDVELSPKKAYVSLRRKKQFAIIQPSTASRIDVGINLKGAAPAGRLEASGSFNAMVTHRVRVSGKGEVNKELIGWLRLAYDKS